MPKKILFSPVGLSDPICRDHDSKEQYFHEGALLQICRNIKFDKIYLYLTARLSNFEKRNNLYTNGVRHVIGRENEEIIAEPISDIEAKNPQDFNYFYIKFKEILQQITEDHEMGSDDILYLNVTSGTPQMESALVVLTSLLQDNISCKIECLQIEHYNSNKNPGINLVKDWESNVDAPENGYDPVLRKPNVVKVPSLEKMHLFNQLRVLIDNYEYNAAFEIGKTFLDENSIELLGMAKCRYNLSSNWSKSNVVENFSVLQSKCLDYDDGCIYEALLLLQIYSEKDFCLEFLRSMTPVFLNILLKYLDKFFDISEQDLYCSESGTYKWPPFTSDNFKKFDELLTRKNHKLCTINNYVTSESILGLNTFKSKCSDKLFNDLLFLRICEKTARNIASHQLRQIDDNLIYTCVTTSNDWKAQNKNGKLDEYKNLCNMKDIFIILKSVYCKLEEKINPDNSCWNSYKEMNKYILDSTLETI